MRIWRVEKFQLRWPLASRMAFFKPDIAIWMSGPLKSSVQVTLQVPLTSLTFTKLEKGCKSGKRSKMAATDLLDAGFSGVKDVAGGYDDWTQNGLPTQI
ncbi:uncharacterized protein LOC107632439 isoform X1 [Arachis ipaensis]|uniref:uncharacterized protein LOC107632439 isoform X1 n=1 Tax=Arachis ipaensis TaxID=130454 RepID=UPI000A2B2D78|nr:uncharacterized protein LOC107632439 isoform X1 [Arachis ipaensis]